MANNPQISGVQSLRPPIGGTMDPPQSLPPMSFQFRPAVPAPQSQQFIPVSSQHFQPIGRGVPPINVAMPPCPPQAPQPFYSQPMQQFPIRAGQLAQDMLPPQSIPLPVAHPNNHPLPVAHPNSHPLPIAHPQPSIRAPINFAPSVAGPGTPLSSSHIFAPTNSQIQLSFIDSTQYQSISQPHPANVSSDGQPMLSTESQRSASVTPQQQTFEKSSMTNIIDPVSSTQPNLNAEALSEWREHTSPDGRKYYYNRRTKLSSWEKPIDLMTPIERADASTNWKEFTSPDGKKYYYNKVTKESKWVIPEELKLAREQLAKASLKEAQERMTCSAPDTASSPKVEPAPPADTSSKAQGITSSPVSVEPVAAVGELQAVVVSGSSSSPVADSTTRTGADGDHGSMSVASTSDTSTGIVGAVTEPMNNSNSSTQDITTSVGVSAHDKEEASKDATSEKSNEITPEDKAVDREPLVYANKQEAKNAFMMLLESANVGSEWTWDRAMRVIITDKRYGALKTLGERKQAFNEFLSQRKKMDAEEKRSKQKKAREEFKKMLEESTELTSSARWSKVESLFENDERFKAVERDRDRRELFENHVEGLQKMERAKALEEHKRNIMEYRQFLESCDFIKANSQWRKLQDRLEADERCSRLEKIDRVDVFQEYIHDLEKEEEEQRKIQKEELRKAERKNRDEFRKLMEDHVAEGILTAKTHWRDYCMKVKDLPAYLAVASNTSGSTAKDLFEDAAEELEKQYHDDRTRIKDAVKLGKIMLLSTWTFDDFKHAITDEIGSPPVSDVNLRLVFDELLERVKEKEEKEAKKRKRLMDDFSDQLSSIKDINASSEWEDCKLLFENSQEYSSIGDENVCRHIFEKYVMQLKERAKEKEQAKLKEQKRKEEKARKEKERKEGEQSKVKQRKEKDERLEKDGSDNETADITESHVSKENKRSGKDSSRKHRKRHHNSEDCVDENENEQLKKSHGSSSDHKKSRRHLSASESDHDSRSRRHRRDHRHGSRRSGDHGELEDGEFGEGRRDS